jgi:F-box protein 18 (helicase)
MAEIPNRLFENNESSMSALQGSRFGRILASKSADKQVTASEMPLAPSPPASTLAAPYVKRTGGLTRGQEKTEDGAPTGGKFQGRGPWKLDIKYGDDQQEIIDCPSRVVVANAFAGTGKTTTAVGYAARRPGSRVLYMPFGKTVQLEAMKRFPPNTWCQTINSAAFNAAGADLRKKLTQSFTPLLIRDEMSLRTNRQAGLVLKVLNEFMTSADREIKNTHLKAITEGSWRASGSEAADALATARMAWRRMTNESDEFGIPHDALLKIWSLKNPKLDYDYIIFDEAQDTNAVTADIISRQDHAVRLYIGDRHQSIYGFRGATNAMEVMSADRNATQLSLAQTWRFGPKIAEIANLILGDLKGEKTPIIGMGKDGVWDKTACFTKLSRTNAQLFRDAAVRQGKGIHWAGQNGIAGYNVNRLTEAYNLFNGDDCKDPMFKRFRSWGEVQAYAEEARDPEIKMLVGVVDEFRHDTPDLVHSLVTNQVANQDDASVVFSTAHKAKGLDWNFVEVADDFKILADTEELLSKDALAEVNDQELNLLYVAFTRAKTALQLNKETKTWMDNLEKHRIDRNLAIQRLERRREASRNFLQRSVG